MQSFFRLNRQMSEAFNCLLPDSLNTDGNNYFQRMTVPGILKPGAKLYDIGGVSQPCVNAGEKDNYKINLVGLDISHEELDAAQEQLHDEKIVADLTEYHGQQDADIVICQAVLEHVNDNLKAVTALASILKPGGVICVFVPCRNALFARLNPTLPQNFKEKLLEYFHPGIGEHQGFPARYDQCTPRQLSALMLENGIEIVEIRLFWKSSYFANFLPAFLIWRFWQLISYPLMREEAAETFILIGRKST